MIANSFKKCNTFAINMQNLKFFNHSGFSTTSHVSSHLRPAFIKRENIHNTGAFFHGEYEMKDPKTDDEIINITFIDKANNKFHVKGKIGDNLLYLAHRYGIEMEGACEASLACTTCHCYIDFASLDKLPSPEEKEEDLLDMAPFLKENSRLGCQIVLTKELEGMEISLPLATRNFYVDGHKPKPH